MEESKDFNIQELHTVQLEILKEFDRVCKKYGLRYFLAYGTLLGAIRHNGFIPWDDDIDTMMPYDDYQRLLSIDPSEWKKPYFVQNENTDPDYGACFTKIRNSETTLIVEQLAHMDINHGVDIDVYPMIHLSDDLKMRKQQFRQTLVYMLLRVGEPPRNHGKIMYLGGKLILGFLSPKNRYKIEKKLLSKITRYQNLDTKESYVISGNLETMYQLLENNWFQSYVLHKFEDCEFPIPSGAKEWLAVRYGENYMQLPPKELQGFKLDTFVKVDLHNSYKKYKGEYYCTGKKKKKVRNFRWVKFS